MTDEEIQRKFDNVWDEIQDWRRFRMKVLVAMISAAFIVGGAWVEARLAIASNGDMLVQHVELVEEVPKIKRNQKLIEKGVNYNGELLREIAKKVGADMPERETVELEDGPE